MTDIMIATAEEEFSEKRILSAFKWASMAKLLDPFYPKVDKYVEVYRIHVAALTRHPSVNLHCYAILGIYGDAIAVSTESITHTFVKLAKKKDPEVHCSKAAPSAFKLIATAFEVLGDTKSRCAFHVRNGLPPPQDQSLPRITTSRAPGARSHGHSSLSDGIRSCRCPPAYVV